MSDYLTVRRDSFSKRMQKYDLLIISNGLLTIIFFNKPNF